MKYDDEVKIMIASKIFAKSKRRIKKLTKDLPEAEHQVMQVILTMSKLFGDVFNYHPSCHAAILILAEAVKEMIEELQKMETDRIIYL